MVSRCADPGGRHETRGRPPKSRTYGLRYRRADSFFRSWLANGHSVGPKKPPGRAKSTWQARRKGNYSRFLWLNRGRSGGGRKGRCYRPRETRSISAFTMRSTSPGRLSSSQDFSIGRSISLTRSSNVRALLLRTVWARVLKADSTAETVVCDRIGGDGGTCGGS